VAEGIYRVELTASFLERMDAIEEFLSVADASFAFDKLIAELRATVLHLVSRESGFIVGTEIIADGGMSQM
jgi:hypothetical protein